MAKIKTPLNNATSPTTRPAINDEAREKQLIALSLDLVEQRLRDKTASAQEVCHFLKLGTQRAKLETEKMEKEVSLLKAKTEVLESQKEMSSMYAEALSAFKRYSGNINENT